LFLYYKNHWTLYFIILFKKEKNHKSQMPLQSVNNKIKDTNNTSIFEMLKRKKKKNYQNPDV